MLVLSIYVFLIKKRNITNTFSRDDVQCRQENNKFDTRENNWLGCFSRKFCASSRIFHTRLWQKPVTRVIGRYTIAWSNVASAIKNGIIPLEPRWNDFFFFFELICGYLELCKKSSRLFFQLSSPVLDSVSALFLLRMLLCFECKFDVNSLQLQILFSLWIHTIFQHFGSSHLFIFARNEEYF